MMYNISLLLIYFIVMHSSGEGNGSLLHYSCLENPVAGGSWWAAVHRVAQSWIRLRRLSMHACMHWRMNWQPTPVFLPGESQGRRSLSVKLLISFSTMPVTLPFSESFGNNSVHPGFIFALSERGAGVCLPHLCWKQTQGIFRSELIPSLHLGLDPEHFRGLGDFLCFIPTASI